MARNRGQKGFAGLIAKDMRNMTFAVLLLLSLAVGGTLAYISTVSDTAANAFAASSAPVPVVMENGTEIDDDVHENTIPLKDGVANKVVQVKNQGSAGFVRVRITLPQQLGADGGYVAYNMPGVDDDGFVMPTLDTTTNRYQSHVGAFTLTFGDTYADKWAYRDGWFYHKGVVAHDATTDALLSSVGCSDPSIEKVAVGVIVETLGGDANSVNAAWGLTTGSGKFAADGSWDAS